MTVVSCYGNAWVLVAVELTYVGALFRKNLQFIYDGRFVNTGETVDSLYKKLLILAKIFAVLFQNFVGVCFLTTVYTNFQFQFILFIELEHQGKNSSTDRCL